jgi:hypothetical protein
MSYVDWSSVITPEAIASVEASLVTLAIISSPLWIPCGVLYVVKKLKDFRK